MDRFAHCPFLSVYHRCSDLSCCVKELGSVAVKRSEIDFRLSRPFLFFIQPKSLSHKGLERAGAAPRAVTPLIPTGYVDSLEQIPCQ
jgi:hypothetical protein